MRPELLKSEKGQALVELALVLPLLLLLLMGIFEFGRIFFDYLCIANASREGARWAAVGIPDDEVINIVENACAALDFNRLQIEISPIQDERARGKPLTVSLRYEVDIIVPLFGVAMPDPFPIEAHTTMRME